MSELVLDVKNLGLSAPAEVLAKGMADVLHRNYPGHLWGVHVDSNGGIAVVRNLALSGNWGFILKIKDLHTDPTLKSVMRAGGELLERYNLARGKLKQDQIQDLKRDFRGIPIADKG